MSRQGRTDDALFIVLEGIDGSGSTTQARLLASWLRREGRRVILTREPTAGPAGALVRLALSGRLGGGNVQLHEPDEPPLAAGPGLDPRALALLYAADRADHLATVVRPGLERGRTVVSDRYLLSSLVYQGRDFGVEWVREINAGAVTPDLTLFVDVPVEEAVERMRSARWTRDLFEEEAQLRALRDRYRRLVDEGIPAVGPVVTVDGSGSPDEVAGAVREAVERHADGGGG